ncbi:MAG: alpha/beta fold hydrolase [Minicystis sp.]
MVGRFAGLLEGLFGLGWSAGELLLAVARFEELRSDPHRKALLDDIEARGFYVPIDPAEVDLRIDARGRVHGKNPYRRVAPHRPEHVVAKLVRSAARPARRLVMVCHCYGVPVPAVMERLFGLDRIDADVAYPIMNHHQRGSYLLWPGSGFSSARPSRFVENVRSAITAARALLSALVHRHEYEHVSVIGFSIGGQLALHLANAERVDRAVLYCPVASIPVTASELGLMRHLTPALRRGFVALKRDDPLADLAVTEPLRYPMRTRPSDVHVIVQKHDALAPVLQVEKIRETYPEVRWHAFDGAHLWPAGLRSFQRIIRGAIEAH